jgi:glutamate dehydrogenase (NAD(P)+)
VTVSYYEWVQNNQHEQWELETIKRKLRQRIRQAVDSVAARWRQFPARASAPAVSEPPDQAPRTDLRTAALVVAIERLAHVTLQRGIWP